jgi:hypothetical protein
MESATESALQRHDFIAVPRTLTPAIRNSLNQEIVSVEIA